MKEILDRIHLLFIKMISIKVLAACVITLLLLRDAQVYGIIGLMIVAFMWTVVIGGRTLEKYIEVLKVVKGGESK